MKALANILIAIAVVSIIAAIIVKLGIFAPQFLYSFKYPFHPNTFLRFANTCLFLAIALFLAQIAKTK